ncbi:MAG: hypothetical protein WCB04_05370 [Mycobacteriales bacterium]
MSEMLSARKLGRWKTSYEIAVDGSPIATWKASSWKHGGTLELDGRDYDVRANMWGNKYGIAAADGSPVASAEHVGRKRWSVESDGQTYDFQRASMWRREELLMRAGEQVGSITRPSMWRSDTQAELPGLPLPVQVFILVVVLSMWDSSDAAGAASATGAAGATAV